MATNADQRKWRQIRISAVSCAGYAHYCCSLLLFHQERPRPSQPWVMRLLSHRSVDRSQNLGKETLWRRFLCWEDAYPTKQTPFGESFRKANSWALNVVGTVRKPWVGRARAEIYFSPSLQSRRFWWVTDEFSRLPWPPLWFMLTEGIGTSEKEGGGRGRPLPAFPNSPQSHTLGRSVVFIPGFLGFPIQDGGNPRWWALNAGRSYLIKNACSEC